MKKKKSKQLSIYIIGSLRNNKVPILAEALRKDGYDVFDDWYSVGPDADDYFRDWTKYRKLTYKEALKTHAAKHIFEFDKTNIDRCDVGVMLMPSGKSGHLELGYMKGTGKKTFILFDKTPKRYDIMVQFADEIFFDLTELKKRLRVCQKK